jgi:hypothetical protein
VSLAEPLGHRNRALVDIRGYVKRDWHMGTYDPAKRSFRDD